VFVVEGLKLVDEAVASGRVVEIFATPAYEAGGVDVQRLAPGVMERVASTVTPQPVLAIVSQEHVALSSLAGPGPVLVCVDVRDPGNLGTVLRTAEASGASGVVCSDGTVDVYNPKCVRGSAGALLRVPVVVGGDPVTVVQTLRAGGRRALATAAGDGPSYDQCDLTGPLAFVLGSESGGLPAPVRDAADGVVHIPMAGGVESLNVGVASAVLCFEAARQRRVSK
jgi:TrmH family RNA methyltransferase